MRHGKRNRDTSGYSYQIRHTEPRRAHTAHRIQRAYHHTLPAFEYVDIVSTTLFALKRNLHYFHIYHPHSKQDAQQEEDIARLPLRQGQEDGAKERRKKESWYWYVKPTSS
jgi:hypothetical protein